MFLDRGGGALGMKESTSHKSAKTVQNWALLYKLIAATEKEKERKGGCNTDHSKWNEMLYGCVFARQTY